MNICKKILLIISFLCIPISVLAYPINAMFYLKPGVTLSDPETVPSTTNNRFPLGGRFAGGFQRPFCCCSPFSWGGELGLGYYGSYRFNTIPNQNYSGIDLEGVLASQLTASTSVFSKFGLGYLTGSGFLLSNNASVGRQTGLLLGAGANYRITSNTDFGAELVHIGMLHAVSSNVPNNSLVPSFNTLQLFIRFCV